MQTTQKSLSITDIPYRLNLFNISAIYTFGSYVYGTNDELSDKDYIVVTKTPEVSTDNNFHFYTEEEFQRLLNNCDIQMLECVFLPQHLRIGNGHPYYINIDKQVLRRSISTISSNSWVKGKKKLTVMGDYDLRIGLKSIYHSLRILDYGIQICQFDKIVDWGRMNYVLEDIKKMSLSYSTVELWEKIDEKYRKTFNFLSSQFKILAPKDTRDSVKKKEIEELLAKYEIYNNDLTTELMAIL